MRVEEVMTKRVVTIAPQASLKEASALLLDRRVSGVPVVDDGKLVGILSESDIVAKETSGYSNGEADTDEQRHLRRERAAQTVAEAMTPSPFTVEPWMGVWTAADLMAVHGVNRLPVVDTQGSLVGIVTRNDLVRAFARTDDDIERDIRENLLPSVGLGPQELEVQAERGVITLTGEIDLGAAADCLRRSVHLIPGVVRVLWKVESPTERLTADQDDLAGAHVGVKTPHRL
jgi:CBS domain-containing protein